MVVRRQKSIINRSSEGLAISFYRIKLIAEPVLLSFDFLISAHVTRILHVHGVIACPSFLHCKAVASSHTVVLNTALALRSWVAPVILVVSHVHLHLVKFLIAFAPLSWRKHLWLDALQLLKDLLVSLIYLLCFSCPNLTVQRALAVFRKSLGMTTAVEPFSRRTLPGKNFVDPLKEMLILFIYRFRSCFSLQLALHSSNLWFHPCDLTVVNPTFHIWESSI